MKNAKQEHMSDHEFEKQVRQKLDDLRLTPTPAAWDKIEQEIRENKRRRAPLFWLPLLLIGLGAGGYFIARQGVAPQLTMRDTPAAIQPQPESDVTKSENNLTPNNKVSEEKVYTNPDEPLAPASTGN